MKNKNSAVSGLIYFSVLFISLFSFAVEMENGLSEATFYVQ
jgi:hypothetical protein